MATLIPIKKKRVLQPQSVVAVTDPSIVLAITPVAGPFGYESTTGTFLTAHYAASSNGITEGKLGKTWTGNTSFDDVGTYNNTAVLGRLSTMLPGRSSGTIITNFYLAPSRATIVELFSNTANNVDLVVKVDTSGNVQITSQGAGGGATFTTNTGVITPGYHSIAVEIVSPTGSEARNFTVWVDGANFGTYSQNWYSGWNNNTSVTIYGPRTYGSAVHSSSTAEVYGLFVIQNVGRGQELSINPWQIFKPNNLLLNTAPSVVSVFRPGSDIAVSGWSAIPSGALYATMNEAVADDNNYARSPDLVIPATMGLDYPMPIGSYNIDVRFKSANAGQVRINLLDAGGSSVGISSWQSSTTSFATYSLSVTTTGIATQFRIEVQ